MISDTILGRLSKTCFVLSWLMVLATAYWQHANYVAALDQLKKVQAELEKEREDSRGYKEMSMRWFTAFQNAHCVFDDEKEEKK